MKNKIGYLLFTFSVISLGIGFYQFFDARLLDSLLSVVYSIVFFIGGLFYFKNRNDIKKKKTA